MRIPHAGRTVLVIPMALVTVLLFAPIAIAAPALGVRGGGVVGGDPGVTSQLGFTATAHGGSFLCVMAGRSGGFPFGPWQQILQMQVQGRVMPETLEIDGSESSFEGLATIRIVGEAGGQIVSATVRDVRFVSRQGAGGAGEAWHLLELPDLQLTIGPAPMKSGHIAVWN